MLRLLSEGGEGLRFTDWLKHVLFGEDKKVNIQSYQNQMQAVALEEFAVNTAINMIAGAVSKCEFRTFLRGTEQFQEEYYLFNIRPNKNQNSSEFIQDWIHRLLYNNEALIVEVSGQLLLADSFSHQEYAVVDDVFTQVCCKGFTFEKPFFMSDVLYFRLNNQDIRGILSGLVQRYAELISKTMERYKKSGGRRGILNISALAMGDPKFEDRYKELMNNRFRTYFDAENAVLPLWDGYQFEESAGDQAKRNVNEVSEIKTLTDEAIARVAQAFKIPPALMRGEVADIGNAMDNFLTLCIDPLCDMLCEEINAKRYGSTAFQAGNHLEIDTTCLKHIDLFDVAANIDKLIASRTYSNNEIRRKLRDSKIPQAWADDYLITKNYAPADSAGKEDAIETGLSDKTGG